MKKLFSLFVIVPALCLAGDVPLASDLPGDAARLVEKFEKSAKTIRDKAEKEIEPLRKQTVERLKVLQDKYCRQARLDEALAIRGMIRKVRGIRSDPGLLRATPGEIGKRYLFEVIGSVDGAIWGTEVYTSDSHLGTAAVHAGVLKPGKKGIIKVYILPGQRNYAGSESNGVTSRAWGKWNVSFSVEHPD